MSRASSPADRVVRKVLADGTVKEYRYARGGAAEQPRPGRYSAGSVGELLLAYQNSSAWDELSKSTKANRTIYLRPLAEALRDQPVEEVKKSHLLDIADAIKVDRGPAAANAFLIATGVLFNWAIERGRFDRANPCFRIKKFSEKHLPAFTREQCDRAEELVSEPLRRVLVLGRYTGQRRGDLIAMTWAAYDGQTLRFTQQKCKAGHEPVKMVLAVHPDLKAELDCWKAQAEGSNVVSLRGDALAGQTILQDFDGKPWQPRNLSDRMKAQLERAGLRTPGERGVNVHGLRKMAAAVLAEEGASVKEIQGVTGHRTLAMIQLYTESADRERLGAAAIARLPVKKA